LIVHRQGILAREPRQSCGILHNGNGSPQENLDDRARVESAQAPFFLQTFGTHLLATSHFFLIEQVRNRLDEKGQAHIGKGPQNFTRAVRTDKLDKPKGEQE
jgi:hypothetical protein